MVAIFIPGERAPLEKMSFFDNQEFNFCSKDFFLTLLKIQSNTEQTGTIESYQKTAKPFIYAFTDTTQRGQGGRPQK